MEQKTSFIVLFKFIPLLLFFFFASRRRHTRSLCDWSSDVCSSDLNMQIFPGGFVNAWAVCLVGIAVGRRARYVRTIRGHADADMGVHESAGKNLHIAVPDCRLVVDRKSVV